MEGGKKMVYRYLGNTGLRVSVLSYGNWLTAHDPESKQAIMDCVKVAYENGVNFFDTAEIYGAGVAETIMGEALHALPCERSDYVLSTKFIKCGEGQNDRMLGAKHLYEGVQASLKRMNMDYFDVIFAHRPDFDTPLEETCRAFDQLIRDRKALYWATSEWSAARITRAIEICKRLNLHEPIADQCQYSLFWRDNPEKGLRPVFEDYGYGTTIWSPLAGGILTGKYNDGVAPEGSRYKESKFAADNIWPRFFGTEEKAKATTDKLKKLAAFAEELGVSQAQLALAWTLVNKDVSTCIFGATKTSQVEDNIKALEVAASWTQEREDRISEIFGNAPEPEMDFRSWGQRPQRRQVQLDLCMGKQLVDAVIKK